MDEKLKQSPTINNYKNVALRMASISRGDIPYNILNDAIDYSIQKRFKDNQAQVENNYKKKTVDLSLLDTCDYIEKKKPILAASGVMFQRHENSTNLIYKIIDEFLDSRTIAKNTMFKYPKGSEDFQYWNLQQLLEKRNANALYGAQGQYSCILYNLYTAESTTTQGRSAISSSILFFEAFLSNNVKFGSLNELITFIDNVLCEERIFDDNIILDQNITRAECFYKLISTCGFNGWIPTERDLDIIWDILLKVSQEDINRLFYKNNLYYFFDNKIMTRAIKFILKELQAPFLNPNKIPEEITAAMDEVYKMVKEYVYYSHQVIDKLGRAENMQRNVSIIIDTDSTIVSFDAWYRYILNKTYDVPMKIKNTEYSIDSFINGSDKMMKVKNVKDKINLEDYSEENVQKERLICPVVMIPQDNLRYSIINIIANICSRLILDYMEKYCNNSNTLGVPGSNRKCLMIQKNEFLFKRAAVCDGKKHYADIQEIQEGNMVPQNMNSAMAVMGLELMKSSLAKQTQEDLKHILYDDILNTRNIDQVNVIKKLQEVENKIHASIKSGERVYLKPAVMKSMNSYDDPMRIQSVRGALVYNKIKFDYMPSINMDERSAVDILKVNINKSNIEPLKDKFPDIYNSLIDILNIASFKDGIKAISLPPDVKIPDWLFDYIDFNTIVNDNLTPFPIETIGISRMDKKSINYTNIIQL